MRTPVALPPKQAGSSTCLSDSLPPQPLKRYYFDYFGDAIASDEEGVELPDIKAAQEEAIHALRSKGCRSGVQRGQTELPNVNRGPRRRRPRAAG